MTPDRLANLHTRAFVHGRPWSAPEFKTLLDQPHVHLSKQDHGFALWRGIGGEAELLTIAVDPTYQRQGIGDALMHSWMGDAKRSCDIAFLEVARDNAAADRLYRRHGFEEVGVRPAYYTRDTTRVDALILRAPLTSKG